MPMSTRPVRWVKAPMIPDALGYVWVAGRSLLQRVNVVRKGSRKPDPSDILVPDGYEVEVVATGFDAPVHCSFGPDGACYVTEAGYRIDSPPRILRVNTATGQRETVFEISPDRWNQTGALTGCAWHDGYLYYAYNDHIGRLRLDGEVEEVVTDLPGRGDHQLSPPTFGPDGRLYFSTGSATNCGVVGADNIAYEWLRNPALRDVCEIPGADITLAGRNYETQDVTGDLGTKVRTGAFVPFGTETWPGQLVAGRTKCTTGVLRCNPDGSDLELLAWGLRNAFGLQHHPDGRLFVTEHGIDERGSRRLLRGGSRELVRLPGLRLRPAPRRSLLGRRRPGARAGHPRAAAGPATAVRFVHRPRRGQRLRLLPGRAVRVRGGRAGGLLRRRRPRHHPSHHPRRIQGRAGRHDPQACGRLRRQPDRRRGQRPAPQGFERPVDCRFGPDGSLYVVDWGEMVPAPERGGVEIRRGTGVLWRIRRTADAERGDAPAAPLVLPVNLLRLVVPAVGVTAAAAAAKRLLRRRSKRSRKKKS